MSAREALAMHKTHLVRKVQASLKSDDELPSDLLTSAAINTQYLGGTGFPDAADSVAYDPVQGLLAVSAAGAEAASAADFTVQSNCRTLAYCPYL